MYTKRYHILLAYFIDQEATEKNVTMRQIKCAFVFVNFACRTVKKIHPSHPPHTCVHFLLFFLVP